LLAEVIGSVAALEVLIVLLENLVAEVDDLSADLVGLEDF